MGRWVRVVFSSMLLALSLPVAVSAQQIFQLGVVDGGTSPPDGSDDFMPGMGWQPVSELDLTRGGFVPIAGYLIGSMGELEAIDMAFRPGVAAAGRIEIVFNVGFCFELTLRLARYGSETTMVTLASEPPGFSQTDLVLGPGENMHTTETIVYSDAGVGGGGFRDTYRLTVEYAGGGADNGHHLDAILMDGLCK